MEPAKKRQRAGRFNVPRPRPDDPPRPMAGKRSLSLRLLRLIRRRRRSLPDMPSTTNGSDLVRDLELWSHTEADDFDFRDEPIRHNYQPAWEALPLATDPGVEEGYKVGSRVLSEAQAAELPRVLRVRREAAGPPPPPPA